MNLQIFRSAPRASVTRYSPRSRDRHPAHFYLARSGCCCRHFNQNFGVPLLCVVVCLPTATTIACRGRCCNLQGTSSSRRLARCTVGCLLPAGETDGTTRTPSFVSLKSLPAANRRKDQRAGGQRRRRWAGGMQITLVALNSGALPVVAPIGCAIVQASPAPRQAVFCKRKRCSDGALRRHFAPIYPHAHSPHRPAWRKLKF